MKKVNIEKNPDCLEENKEKLDENNEYIIFGYLKVHTNVLVSVVSACVIVISFLLNMAVYFHKHSYLTFWNINSETVNINISNQIYFVVVSLVYAAIILWTTSIISNSHEAFWKQKKVAKALKYKEKNLKGN